MRQSPRCVRCSVSARRDHVSTKVEQEIRLVRQRSRSQGTFSWPAGWCYLPAPVRAAAPRAESRALDPGWESTPSRRPVVTPHSGRMLRGCGRIPLATPGSRRRWYPTELWVPPSHRQRAAECFRPAGSRILRNEFVPYHHYCVNADLRRPEAATTDDLSARYSNALTRLLVGAAIGKWRHRARSWARDPAIRGPARRANARWLPANGEPQRGDRAQYWGLAGVKGGPSV